MVGGDDVDVFERGVGVLQFVWDTEVWDGFPDDPGSVFCWGEAEFVFSAFQDPVH